MPTDQISRRAFLKTSSTLAKGSFILLAAPAILTACQKADEAINSEAQGFSTLSDIEARELRAIAARIIPSDESPGAEEAGVIFFIDAVLGDNRDQEYRSVREALLQVQYNSALKFSASYFADMSSSQQDELLTEIENTAFFATIRYLTIAGMFSLPRYGGNKNKLGYELIGFDDQHAWAPPFGFYDADYAARGE